MGRRSLLGFVIAACGSRKQPRRTRDSAFEPASFSVTRSGAGSPVVFLPGAATAGDVWNGVIAHMGGRIDAHVVTIRGFCSGTGVPAPVLATVRDELARYIRDRGLRRPTIVGHSIGGFLAYWLAISAPDVVGGLVIVDAAPYAVALRDPSQTAATFEPIARHIRDGLRTSGHDAILADSRTRFAEMVHDPVAAERLAIRAAGSSPITLGNALYELYTTDLRGTVGRIAAPVLVLLAKDDVTVAEWPAYENRWHEQLAPIVNHEIVVVPQSRHYIMIDAPEALTAALDRFLAARAAQRNR